MTSAMAVPDPSGEELDRAPVAVTGASGHLGANLVRLLLARGRSVRAIVHRSRRGLDGLPVESVAADLHDESSLRRALAGAGTVFHLAAKVSAGWEPASAVVETNVRGTANLVHACQVVGIRRLVHFSSIQALAPRRGAAVDETAPLVRAEDREHGPYDRAKAEAERIVLDAARAGLPAVILNPTAVLGPYDFQRSPMGDCLRALARGRLPALVAPGEQDFVDARDVAAAALAAERRGRSGERYLLSGTRLSLVELARRWAAVTGHPAPRLAVPMSLARAAAPFAAWWARRLQRRPLLTPESLRMLRLGHPVDRAKAEHELEYRPRPIEETLRDTWAWMKTEEAP